MGLSAYDRLILSEPSLVSYAPLHDAGGDLANLFTPDLKTGGRWQYKSTAAATFGGGPALLPSDRRASVTFGSGGGVDNTEPSTFPVGGAPWALECWTLGIYGNGNEYPVIGIGNENGTQFGMIGVDSVAGVGYWFCGYWASPAGFVAVEPTSHTNDGKVHHIVGTYAASTYAIYVDGVLAATGSATSALTSGFMSFGIGQQAGVNVPISKVAVYTSALSRAQILQHYQAGLRSGLLPTVTPAGHLWPILAVQSSSITSKSVSDSAAGQAEGIAFNTITPAVGPDTGAGADQVAVGQPSLGTVPAALTLTMPETANGRLLLVLWGNR